jgi:hypothetical protein
MSGAATTKTTPIGLSPERAQATATPRIDWCEGHWSTVLRVALRQGRLWFALALAACGTSQVAACHVAADCASGVCRADGTCGAGTTDAGSVTFGDAGVAAPDGKGSDTQGNSDGKGTVDTGQPGSDVAPATCAPNGDGVITRAEIPFVVGAEAHWRSAAHVSFDTAGVAQADGGRGWDASAALPGDKAIVLHTDPIAGTWFADKFKGATYASQLSQDYKLLGVFEVTSEALLLRGVVSPTDGLTRTLLTYTPPIPMLKFPLQVGATWQTTASVSNEFGVPVYTEAYAMQVDAHGTFATPLGKFPVLRVLVKLDRATTPVPVPLLSQRSMLFVAECIGTVASIDLETSDAAAEPKSAASLRRIAPLP